MCRRCQADHVETDGRGLCLACRKTEALPGMEPQPWDLRLTNPEGCAPAAKPDGPTQERLL